MDTRGRIVARSPFYEENFLVVDVPLGTPRQTLHTRWGDWFPIAVLALFLLLAALGLARPRLR